MIVRASRGATTWWTTAGLCTLLAVLAGIASPRPAFAETGCTDASGHEVPPIAHLVSTVGEVSVAGSAPRGEAPYRPICAGETVVVGRKSRAGVNLMGADTPLGLDRKGPSECEARPDPGSGLVELV